MYKLNVLFMGGGYSLKNVFLLLILPLLLISCNTSVAPKDSKTIIIAETSYDNGTEGVAITAKDGTKCERGDSAVRYSIGLVSTISSPLTKPDTSSVLCGKTGEIDNIAVKKGITVKLVATENTQEVEKVCTDKKGVHVTITQYEDGANGKTLLSTPFHTNTLCYNGVGNSTGDNVVVKPVPDPEDPDNPDPDNPDKPDVPSDETIVIELIQHEPATPVKPLFAINQWFGFRSSIVSAGVSDDDKEIHFLYGMNYSGTTIRFINTHYSYNIKTKIWTKLDGVSTGDVPKARADASITSVGNNIYMYGGRGDSSDGNMYNDPDLQEFYKYDIKSKTWTKMASANSTSPQAATITAVGDKIYAFGGANTNNYNANANGIYMFDTKNENAGWQSLNVTGDKPTARMYHQAAAVGTKIYYYGGVSNWNDRPDISDPFVYFDTANNSWHKIDNPPSNVRAKFSLVALDDKHLLISSGQSANGGMELRTFIYNLANGTKYEVPTNKLPAFASQGSGYAQAYQKDYVLGYYVKDPYLPNTVQILKAPQVTSSLGGSAAPQELTHYELKITFTPKK